MTIGQALKSGQPFKRQGQLAEASYSQLERRFELTKEDILAEDWEVLPEPKRIAWISISGSVYLYPEGSKPTSNG